MTLIGWNKKIMDKRTMENMVVNEITKEELEVVELIEDMDKLFSISMASQVILWEIVRFPQRHVITVHPLTM